ncbi:TetR/AcrR family transcriptional regulator [Nocardia jejuensis]|uniref:TetR/AcrR family transcriptional regulator n=1 Tax=Nocardia jejuensis TaxID=328049 RepID=UPI0008298803|nr:TetR/AcrR family transcriptional regulator [Nocardia jejuensis]
MAAQDKEIQSVWTRAERRRRGQPALSRDHIVAEAMALLDAEGTEALSMRKLGARLGAGATSLYTYVTNKEELLELTTDAAFGEISPPVPVADGDWRPAVRDVAYEVRSMILRHPWLSSVLGEIGLLYLGPSVMRLNEGFVTLLEEAGFEPVDADTAVTMTFAFVIGLAITEAASLQTIRRSGLTEAEWYRKFWPAAEVATRPYPRMHKRYLDIGPQLAEPGLDMERFRRDSFDTQMDRLLDGLDPALRKAR